MKKELLRLITTLIGFESTEKNTKGRKACASWIERELKRATRHDGVRIETVTHNGVQSVLGMRGKWEKPDILLNGHYDVVAGTPSQFQPVVKGDRIYGRGAADMKGAVAALMTAFIRAVNTKPNLSIGIMLTGDEEIGGPNGAEWLAAKGWKPQLLINFDGGYGEELTHAEKGILCLRISAKGSPALTTYSWEGNCAFEKIIHAYNVLHNMFPERHEATRENNWVTTFAATTVNAKSRMGDTVIDEAYMDVTIHFVERITPEALFKKIKKHLPDVIVKNELCASRVWMRKDHPEMLRFQNVYARYLGHTPKIRGENGSSDARFFTHLNIPIIITKPTGGNPELDNEWVSLRSVEKLTRATIDFLTSAK